MKTISAKPQSLREKTVLVLAWCAAAAAAVEFVWRAFIRGYNLRLTDFAYPYISTRLWLAGANPYDPGLFFPTWYASGATNSGLPDALLEAHSVYPPMAFIPLAPLALLRWPDAVHVYLACGLLLYAAAVFGLLRLAWPRESWATISRDPRAVFYLAFALGLAPIHTAFNSQNIVLIATGAAISTIYLLAGRSRSGPLDAGAPAAARLWIAGVAITAALCLKPTTGIFLLPWLVRDRRWKLIAGVVAACTIITAISLEPLLAHHGTVWLDNYRFNVGQLFDHGGNADVSHANYVNTDRIDLQLVLFAILNSRSLSSLAAFSIYTALLAAFFYYAAGVHSADGRNTNPLTPPKDIPLLVAAGSLTLGMLPVYSRMYSAGIILPLLLWCLLHLRLSAARWMLVLLSDFLINSGALVRKLFGSSGIATGSPRLWDATVGGHTCWLLLAIGLLLVQAMRQQACETAPQTI